MTMLLDIWGIGCTMAELLLGHPLFPGKDELDQIKVIFSVLGSPTKRIWPEVEMLDLVLSGAINLRRDQEKYPYNNLHLKFPRLSKEGLELLTFLLAYNPDNRISAKEATRHDYFYSSRPYPKEEELMPTFKSLHDKVSEALHKSSNR